MKGHCRKVYLAMDTATGDLCAVVFAFSDKGDSPILPRLLAQILLSEQIGTVTGDGGATRSAALQRSRIAMGHGGHSHPQERATMAGGLPRRSCAQRDPPRDPTLGPSRLESLDRASHPKSGRGEDDLAGSFEPVAFTCSN